MTAHFATRLLDENGDWRSQVEGFNIAADLSPTASQMPKLVGLAYASRLYRQVDSLDPSGLFSRSGNEIAFGTIGDASCAEGLFWESVNAAGVLSAPMLLSVWDDGFGISVPTETQVTKGNISALVRGFQREPGGNRGYDIYTAKGWDYPGLCETYLTAAEIVRKDHVPAIIHVQELTQPQGHSTSGSHERYKSAERLEWEAEHDGLLRMRLWMEREGIAVPEELDELEAEDKRRVRALQREAWDAFRAPIEADREKLVGLLASAAADSPQSERIEELRLRTAKLVNPLRRDLQATATEALVASQGASAESIARLREWRLGVQGEQHERYATHVYSETSSSALRVSAVAAEFSDGSEEVRGLRGAERLLRPGSRALPESRRVRRGPGPSR